MRHFEQETDQKIWKIIEYFYRSYLTFRDLRKRYGEVFQRLAEERGTDPESLRLDPQELGELFDFKKLEILREQYLFDLKELCHEIFRGHNHTDLLDRYVSDIFHEISILKEEHYNVLTSAKAWAKADAKVELDSIVGEARSLFPQKVAHIDFLYQKARARLESLFPEFADRKIVVRSLYLHRDGFVKDCYPGGIQHFYRLMFPDNGPVEGYYHVGLSFYNSGFLAMALEAFRGAKDHAIRHPTNTATEKRIIRSIDTKVRRIAGQEQVEKPEGAAL